MGHVQWRATVRWNSLELPVAQVSEAVCLGTLETLDRRKAITTANRRALWRLGLPIADELNRRLSLHLEERRLQGETTQSYRQRADDWSELPRR